MFGYPNNKRQSENGFNAKRHLEESGRHGVHHIDNSQWIENSFNINNNNFNKKPKFDNQLNNSFVTNNLRPTEDMNVQMSDTDDFDDGLDDLYSQMVDEAQTPPIIGQSSAFNNPFQTQNIGLNRTSVNNPSNVTTTSITRSDSDISMRTHPQSSSESSEASEGRIRILESRTNALNEELLKAKKQQILTSNTIREIKEDCKKQILKEKEILTTKLQFANNQNNLQSSLIEQLQKILKSHAPNAPILSMTSDFLKSRKNCQNFSQIKCQEFFAPLSSGSAINSGLSGSHSSQNTVGDVIVNESQRSVGLNPNRMARFSGGSFPSQVPTTQFHSSDTSMPSVTQPMDTTSVPTVDEMSNSQKSGLSQNTKMIWNSIRTVLEHKFTSDQNLLNTMFFGQQIDDFGDQWLNTRELSDWTQSLSNLSIDKNLKIKSFLEN